MINLLKTGDRCIIRSLHRSTEIIIDPKCVDFTPDVVRIFSYIDSMHTIILSICLEPVYVKNKIKRRKINKR